MQVTHHIGRRGQTEGIATDIFCEHTFITLKTGLKRLRMKVLADKTVGTISWSGRLSQSGLVDYYNLFSKLNS